MPWTPISADPARLFTLGPIYAFSQILIRDQVRSIFRVALATGAAAWGVVLVILAPLGIWLITRLLGNVVLK